MTAVTLGASAVVIPVVSVEIAVRRAKLQTAIARVLAVWSAAFVAVAAAVAMSDASSLLAVTVFWGGGFLAWFGVRSHIESSILLRMLVLLRRRAMADAELVAAYMSQYGEAARVEELRRGGLIGVDHDQLALTKRGKAVLTIVSRLR